MVTKRLARHNLVAVFASFDGATAALDDLFGAGLTAEELSLVGPEHTMRPGSGDVAADRAIATGGVGKSLGAGLSAGMATGGALGALLGLAATAIPGVGLAAGAGALYGAVAGGVMGHIPGALLGAEAGARKGMMWTQTLEPLLAEVAHGRVLVGVHSNDPGRVELGEKQLAELSTVQVERLDADEDFQPPGDVAAIAGQSLPSDAPEAPGAELGYQDAETRVGMDERQP